MNKQFPIQGEFFGTKYLSPTIIPWWLAEIAYEYYAKKYGTQQSLDRLAERGGFGRDELIRLIRQNI